MSYVISDHPKTLNIALKEWHLVTRALLAGTQSILLRKGGILEANNEFELEHQKFLLFPTFIHQDPEGLKPAARADAVQLRQEPDRIKIEGWAQVAKIWQVPGRPQMDQLDDLHTWAQPLIDMRFNYRPEKPLYLLALRAFRLPQTIEIANTLQYAGCKSWVPLAEEISLQASTPALAEEALQKTIQRIQSTLAP